VLTAVVLASCGGSGESDVTFAPSTAVPSTANVTGPSAPSNPTSAPAIVGSSLNEKTLVLAARAVGPVALGGDPDAVIGALGERLGAPTDAGQWGPSASSYGSCPGTELLVARWGPLVVLFGNGADAFSAAGRRHAFAWRLEATNADAPGPIDAALANGVHLGSTRAEVLAAFGGDPRLIVADDVLGPSFTVGAGPVLIGGLSSIGNDGRVVYLEGGVPCGA
jgi:hypothetical protein